MSYRVEQNGSFFCVIENETELVIRKCSKEKNARDTCRNLNLGAGFQGFTPSFFAKDEKSS